MRKSTLAVVSGLLAYIIVFGLWSIGLSIPFLSPIFAGLFLAPVLLAPLSILNKRLVAWRKERGRDIEEEEKYENEEAGVISLRPRN